MKKLLSALLLAPLAIASCSGVETLEPPTSTPEPNEPAPVAIPGTYTAYAYTYGGFITKATVTTDGTNITDATLDETYFDVNISKKEWEEIAADDEEGNSLAERRINREENLTVFTAGEKAFCARQVDLYDGVFPGWENMEVSKWTSALSLIEQGTKFDGGYTISQTICEKTYGNYKGTWIEAGKTHHFWADLYEVTYDYGRVLEYTENEGFYNKNDFKPSDEILLESKKMKNTKLTSLEFTNLAYKHDVVFNFKEHWGYITDWFIESGKNYATSNISTKPLSLTNSANKYIDDYTKTVQAAIRRAIVFE